MSSPYTSLNRYRKLPFAKNPTVTPNDVPYDENAVPNSQTARSANYRYSNEDAQLLDDVTSRIAMDNMKTNRSVNDSRIRAPTDLDLLQLTMNRMQKAESDARYLTSELKDKTQRIAVFEEKTHLYEKALQKQYDESFKIETLEKKCARLQSIIDRMEDLLIERGLEVIGGLSEPDNVNILTFDEADRVEQQQQPQSIVTTSGASTWRPEESIPSILPIDYNSILANIRELNVLAGESEMHFEANNLNNQRNISTLKRTETISLILYANGIFLFNGPFRPFSDPSTQQFIRDILDGFFPTELQKRFPDGVPFHVSDKRDIYFTDERKQKAFHGEGYVLHDSRIVQTNQNIDHLPPIPQGVKTESNDQRPKVPVNQFLNRLPKTVIKNGQVIDVRQDIEQHLVGKQQESTARCESAISEYKPDADNNIPFSTLRIRSHDGQQTYVIKMKITSTIKDVKQILTKKKKLLFDFDLFAMGTKLFFTDENQTLEQCNLIPNATLGIREIKQNTVKK
ncbi:unnamed protein product [Adineta steineri]|uniref:UBX domain-containing protein 11 n=1 Tax=Adineta steineri TaxID=433720 RepID=A0A815ITH2_9BILA|nr:unnamed protein product [Adineta steineri]CAF3733021.1 unnamed protein product [Adineta steineri]